MSATETPNNNTVKTITAAEAAKQLDQALILDVRTPAEYASAHVSESVLHPLSDLVPEEIEALAKDKSACLIFCQSGSRSRKAADLLAKHGVKNLVVVDGGINAWDNQNLPLIKGRQTMSLERQVRVAAGSIVLLGVIFGFVFSPGWFALSGFVGAGLVFAGITDTCGMGMLLAKMPWNNRP